jgi:hypothetical protein
MIFAGGYQRSLSIFIQLISDEVISAQHRKELH